MYMIKKIRLYLRTYPDANERSTWQRDINLKFEYPPNYDFAFEDRGPSYLRLGLNFEQS